MLRQLEEALGQRLAKEDNVRLHKTAVALRHRLPALGTIFAVGHRCTYLLDVDSLARVDARASVKITVCGDRHLRRERGGGLERCAAAELEAQVSDGVRR